jgi:hypothetical protein
VSLSPKVKWPEREPDHSNSSSIRLRMSGVIHLLPPAWRHGGNRDSFTKGTLEALCWMITLPTFTEYTNVSKQNSIPEDITSK